MSTLHLATMNGLLENIPLLVKYGADPNIKDAYILLDLLGELHYILQ